MKLPRWIVVVMLCAALIMATVVPAYWWLSWPGKTMAELVSLVEQGRMEEANGLLVFDPDWTIAADSLNHMLRQSYISRPERTFQDVLLGRKRYLPIEDVAVWAATDEGRRHVLLESVTVERGRIVCR
jgi:hypothetical protein